MEIENVFEVEAPPDRVYAFLLDVEHIVGCVPGAELVETIDDNTFKGRVRIKVGPITVSYTGNAEIADRNAEAHTAVLKASGRETTGSGSARATANMSVNAKDGGSEVRFLTDFSVAGRVANFGRGVMEDVSRRLVGQMANCIKANLEVDDGGTPDPPAADPPPAASGPMPQGEPPPAASGETPESEPPPEASSGTPAADAPPEPSAETGRPRPEAAVPPAFPIGGTTAPDAGGDAGKGEPESVTKPPAETPAAEAVAAETSAPAEPATHATPARTPVTAEAKPINALSLFFSILAERIKRLFGGGRS